MNEVTSGSYWKYLENRVEELAEELTRVNLDLEKAKALLEEYERNVNFNHDGNGGVKVDD